MQAAPRTFSGVRAQSILFEGRHPHIFPFSTSAPNIFECPTFIKLMSSHACDACLRQILAIRFLSAVQGNLKILAAVLVHTFPNFTLLTSFGIVPSNILGL